MRVLTMALLFALTMAPMVAEAFVSEAAALLVAAADAHPELTYYAVYPIKCGGVPCGSVQIADDPRYSPPCFSGRQIIYTGISGKIQYVQIAIGIASPWLGVRLVTVWDADLGQWSEWERL